MIELIHLPGAFPVLSTIGRLEDATSHATVQWWRVWVLFYQIVIISFVSWHVLFHVSEKGHIGGTLLTQFLSVFPDVVLLCLLCVYEFRVRPLIKDRLQEFVYHELPQATHFLLDTVPVGYFSSIFACLIILYLWAAQSRKSSTLISGIWWTLLICGLFLLLALPVALLVPLI